MFQSLLLHPHQHILNAKKGTRMLRLSILPTLLLLGTLFSVNNGDPMPVRRRPDPPRPMEASDECAGRSNGESFLSSDGCNTCFCSNGMAACTMMMCPPVVESINCKEDEEHLPNDPLCCRKKNDHSAIYCA